MVISMYVKAYARFGDNVRPRALGVKFRCTKKRGLMKDITETPSD